MDVDAWVDAVLLSSQAPTDTQPPPARSFQFVSRHSPAAGAPLPGSQESPLRDRSLSISLVGAVLVFLKLLLLSLASFKVPRNAPHHCFTSPFLHSGV